MQAMRYVDVAVGVVVRQSQVLIAWRDAALDQGGCYEFPGGKVEANESSYDALCRELLEEINIKVQHAKRLCVLTHQYPNKAVRLWVFYVDQFAGEPKGLQGQQVTWVAMHALANYTFPEANKAFIPLIALPPYLAITPHVAPEEIHHISFQLNVPTAKTWTYLRQHHLNAEDYFKVLQRVHAQLPAASWVVSAHQCCAWLDAHDWSTQKIHELHDLFMHSSVTALHFREQELHQKRLYTELRRYFPFLRCIAACHSASAIQQANELGMQVILLGPVYAPSYNAHADVLGLHQFAALACTFSGAVYGLGGLSALQYDEVIQHNGYGVSGIHHFIEKVSLT